jgi:hypothetical protein
MLLYYLPLCWKTLCNGQISRPNGPAECLNESLFQTLILDLNCPNSPVLANRIRSSTNASTMNTSDLKHHDRMWRKSSSPVPEELRRHDLRQRTKEFFFFLFSRSFLSVVSGDTSKTEITRIKSLLFPPFLHSFYLFVWSFYQSSSTGVNEQKASLNSNVFCAITPCRLVIYYRRFRGVCCLCFEGGLGLPWRWKNEVPLKPR